MIYIRYRLFRKVENFISGNPYLRGKLIRKLKNFVTDNPDAKWVD